MINESRSDSEASITSSYSSNQSMDNDQNDQNPDSEIPSGDKPAKD